jgi:anti-sigma regulatory factor (Ser/Thr protein kinase)
VIKSRRFEAWEESVGEARRFVAEIISDLPIDLQDSVRLMVSELSTNALVHALSGFEVSVERSDVAVIISISDQGNGTPTVESPSPSEPHGRGLQIVDTLSDNWGLVSSSEAGKTVWFRMSLRRPSEGPLDVAATREVRADRSDGPTSHPTSPSGGPEISQLEQRRAHNRAHRHRIRTHARLPVRNRV